MLQDCPWILWKVFFVSKVVYLSHKHAAISNNQVCLAETSINEACWKYPLLKMFHYYYYYYYFYSYTRKRCYWVTFKLEDIHRRKFCATTFFICHYTDIRNGECQPRIGLFTPFIADKITSIGKQKERPKEKPKEKPEKIYIPSEKRQKIIDDFKKCKKIIQKM